MNTNEQDIALAQRIRINWNSEGLHALSLQVWPIPRPKGGIGLWVNILCEKVSVEASPEKPAMLVKSILRLLLRENKSHLYSGLQFAIYTREQSHNKEKTKLFWKVFFESDKLRLLENQPDILEKRPLVELCTSCTDR